MQAYTRIRIGSTGCRWTPSPASTVVESMGYEYWPQALEASIRHAVDVTGVPVYVTENGIGIDDDETRIRYVTEALEGRRPLPRRRARRARLLLLVAARQLRVGGGLQAPLRPRAGRPGDLRPHAQAQRGLARRHRPGQPALP